MRYRRHPARHQRLLASIAVMILTSLALSACGTTGGGGWSGRPSEARAERFARNGGHAEAADIYISLATNASSAERDRLTLLAVEQWLDASDALRARNAFRTVSRPAGGDLLWLWSANSAALSIHAGNPDDALEILEALSRELLTLERRLRIESLRADAWFQIGDPTRAIQLLMHRETWLGSRQSIARNREHLWQGLTDSNPKLLREAVETAVNPLLSGWLTLGSLAATTGQQGIGWSNGVRRWRDEHRGHPAMKIIDEMDLPQGELLEYPRRIALLLPLSGPTASAGKAIQNGFLGAYFAAAGGLDDRQTVNIYDVNAEGGASAAYSAAVDGGAEFVVGPLLRNNVSTLANDILVPVPVLTLNYLPDETLAPPGLYQFALAPEDEAASAAERALADGHARAVALVPNNRWGRRVLSSFSQRFESNGGTLLDARYYTPGDQDFSTAIEGLMALSGSVRRYQRMRANIGGPLQFDPRRRQDAEFVFLAADAPAGRLLKAQLKFHYSGDLPVYSTSSINSMDGRSNTDLNGVMFADTPWVIAPQSWIKYLPELYRRYWPEERRLGRLHAMGYDAFHLVAPLFAVRSGPMPEIDGATGQLYLDGDGRVHRRLAWAEFQRGEPVALPDSGQVSVPIEDIGVDGHLLPTEDEDSQPWYEPTREL